MESVTRDVCARTSYLCIVWEHLKVTCSTAMQGKQDEDAATFINLPRCKLLACTCCHHEPLIRALNPAHCEKLAIYRQPRVPVQMGGGERLGYIAVQLAALDEDEGGPSPPALRAGDRCVAKFSADGQWYRAQA